MLINENKLHKYFQKLIHHNTTQTGETNDWVLVNIDMEEIKYKYHTELNTERRYSNKALIKCELRLPERVTAELFKPPPNATELFNENFRKQLMQHMQTKKTQLYEIFNANVNRMQNIFDTTEMFKSIIVHPCYDDEREYINNNIRYYIFLEKTFYELKEQFKTVQDFTDVSCDFLIMSHVGILNETYGTLNIRKIFFVGKFYFRKFIP